MERDAMRFHATQHQSSPPPPPPGPPGMQASYSAPGSANGRIPHQHRKHLRGDEDREGAGPGSSRYSYPPTQPPGMMRSNTHSHSTSTSPLPHPLQPPQQQRSYAVTPPHVVPPEELPGMNGRGSPVPIRPAAEMAGAASASAPVPGGGAPPQEQAQSISAAGTSRRRGGGAGRNGIRAASNYGPKVVACNFCRARKTKCDGVNPSCSSCARRQLPCSYVTEPNANGGGRGKRANVAALQQQIQQQQQQNQKEGGEKSASAGPVEKVRRGSRSLAGSPAPDTKPSTPASGGSSSSSRGPSKLHLMDRDGRGGAANHDGSGAPSESSSAKRRWHATEEGRDTAPPLSNKKMRMEEEAKLVDARASG
ncbi:hypothetical protein SCHPADRAFT_387208 [Schizopora paradoxa]|uniref:Zn(2)-C6 fungal-type domain-containing protein n=1 Tax=Schizopora paradoxa TaxID=27342 RepID=A0A0H2RN13_9AGAM|nr:hypothetical protein SCHPADRAFT_387208 [Schizopora paradoxa]